MPKKTETHSLPPLYRSATIENIGRADGDDDDRTVALAFSSEQPVERWFGNEILDHKPGSVRMDWFKNGTAPLLMDHNSRDQIGVITQANIGNDRVGRATVRFGKGARADEILQDVRDGVRANISVGYRIHHAVREEIDEENENFRVDDWEPSEVSFVSVPADQTVGVGRAGENDLPAIFETLIQEGNTMPPIEDPNRGGGPAPTPSPAPAPTLQPVDTDALRADVQKQERERISEIMALGTRHNMHKDANEAVRKGTSLEAFRGVVLDNIGEAAPIDNGPGDLDLSTGDTRTYSLLRAINAAASGNWKEAEFEAECSREIAERVGGEGPKGFYVPTDIQRQSMNMGEDVVRMLQAMQAKRDLSVGVAAAGGNLVGTDHMAASFIDILRNAMRVRQMGAQVISGLRGNVQIPAQTGAGVATWVATEDADSAETDQTFGLVPMQPRTVAAFTEMTRQLLLQSDPSVEQLVRGDLAMSIGLAIDQAAINGSGAAGQPTGILNTVGIGDVTGAANGSAPTWADIVNIWREVAIDNADFGSTGWMLNATSIATLATTEKAANTAKFILDSLPGPDGMVSVAGQRGSVSNQVPSNLVKGASGATLSAMIYGNWRDLIIGEWGVLDILVDPYTNSQKGRVKVHVFQSVDVAVRRAQSFSAKQDTITT